MNLNDLIVEAQALDTTTLEGLKPAVDKLIADLQAFVPTSELTTTAPTVVSVSNVIGFSDGTSQTFPVVAV